MFQQLTATDSGMLFVESRESPNHIAPVMIFDQSTAPGGMVRFRDIVTRLEEALDHAPNFRRKIVSVPFNLDEPYWVDDAAFNVDFHVRHMALPQPGDWRQFCIQVARLLSRPLDFSHSPWEMYVIEGLNNVEGLPENCFAVVFKIHHAMIDGMGMIALMNHVWEFDPKPRPPKKRKAWQPKPGPTAAQIALRGWMHSWQRPVQFATRLSQNLPSPISLGRKGGEVSEDGEGKSRRWAPQTILNGKITPARVFDARYVDLARVKKIRKLVKGATVNDVVLATIGGAMRRYFLAKDALPESSVIGSVPISVRSEENKDQVSGNEIIFRNLPIRTDEGDPIKRLAAIHEATSDMKSGGAQSGAALMDLATQLPGVMTGFLARGITALGERTNMLIANTGITNVPGPQVPMYLLGAKGVRMAGGMPCPGNCGVMHAIGSYDGQLAFNITGVRDLLPDPDFYMQCIEDSFDELAKLAKA